MKIDRLFYKPLRGKPVIEVDSLNLIKGYGIENDIHGYYGNPRQVLIVSQSTLKDFNLQGGNLWENIVVDEDIESYQSGQVIRIGEQVLIRLMFHCEPCKNLEQVQLGLMKKINTRRGFLGIVVEGGIIKPQDTITLTTYLFNPLSDIVKQRFNEFIARIPNDKLVNTTDLLLALGVSKAYYRSIPILIKNSDRPTHIHKLVKKDGSLFDKYIPHQKELLESKGIVVFDNKVDYSQHAWEKKQYHQIEYD